MRARFLTLTTLFCAALLAVAFASMPTRAQTVENLDATATSIILMATAQAAGVYTPEAPLQAQAASTIDPNAVEPIALTATQIILQATQTAQALGITAQTAAPSGSSSQSLVSSSSALLVGAVAVVIAFGAGLWLGRRSNGEKRKNA